MLYKESRGGGGVESRDSMGREKNQQQQQQRRVYFRSAGVDAVAGALAGGVSRTITAPLDVIKIRFQVQLEPTSTRLWVNGAVHGSSKYTGIMQATRDILQEEGILGLWRGNIPGLLMVMPYTAIQFTVLQKFKAFATGSTWGESHMRLNPLLSYVSGAVAGCAATIGSYPFDLLRTILASQGEPKIYPNLRAAFIGVTQTRGMRGLYSGLTPTIIEIIPYAGIQFGSYDTFKRWALAWNRKRVNMNVYSNESLSSLQQFMCGLAAGTVAKICCHPLDVVKKRFQVFGLQRHPRYGARVEEKYYKNVSDAIRRIVQAEGLAGLYKGTYPSVIKAAPAAAVTFLAYEKVSVWLHGFVT